MLLQILLRCIRCVQGVTGSPSDDMIVPIAINVMSQAGALDYANKISDAIITNMAIILNGTTTSAGVVTAPAIVDGKINVDTLTNRIKETFGKTWVMKTMGVAEVQNSNIITLAQKMFIASLASRANEFIQDRGGWLERNGTLFVALITMMFVVSCNCNNVLWSQ